MRSRERKLQLFLELFHPGPDTTVLDVGVTNAPFGGGSSDNFFEALYPWPAQITGVGHTELDRFAVAFPDVRAVRADGRELPFDDVLDPLTRKELSALFPYSVRVINTGMTLIAVGPE